jgi:hypothetical protein
MKMPLLVLTAALCVSVISGQAEAYCGDPTQSCSKAFSKDAVNPQDGTTSSQRFDAQTGRQWSGNTTRFGNFTLYGGASQDGSLNNPQSRFGDRLGNPAALNSQGRTNNDYCALYGTCH